MDRQQQMELQYQQQQAQMQHQQEHGDVDPQMEFQHHPQMHEQQQMLDQQQMLEQQQMLAAMQQQPVVKSQVGDWLICEDAQGEFYQHAPTNQVFAEPPQELLDLLPQQQQQ